MLPAFAEFYGVDFSGAKAAGNGIWVARLEPVARRRKADPPFVLASLDRLADLAGTADRGPALAHLVELVLGSRAALWGFDFPFGLPVELFPPGATWADQLAFLAGWGDDAYGLGLECVRRAKALAADGCPDVPHRTALHVRRRTDVDAKAPFDTFHYRIIYQTFFGMRDVVGRLRAAKRTAVLPFQYRRLPTADRVCVECCPGTVLKRFGLPHQNYKQPAGGPLRPKRRRTRHAILDWVGRWAAVSDRDRRRVMRNPGGDALDAVLSAVGAALAVPAADHAAIRRHPRYPREGHLFC